MTTEDMTDDNPVLDRASIDRDIAAGAKAFGELLRNTSMDWTRWSATILGLRGLRTLAFEKAGTNNMNAQAYRDAMSQLLDMRKHSVYNQIDKPTRSDCYRLMDCLDEVDAWYSGLPTADKLRWKHPTTIAKHCPRQFLKGGLNRHNTKSTTSKNKRPKKVDGEVERLRQLLILVIQELARHDPTAYDRWLNQLHVHLDDRTDDLYANEALQ